MPKEVKNQAMNRNPKGKGGFAENPANRKPGPGRGHKRPIPESGASIVRDMEQAYTTAETRGESPGVTAARKLLKEDYAKFMMIYTRAAGPAGASSEVEVPEVVEEAKEVVPGEKELRVDELAERLLREWEVEDAGAK